MNILKYGNHLSKFYGCANYRVCRPDTIVLSFADIAWEPWLVPRLHRAERVFTSSDKQLVRAFKVFFKTEAVTSVFCKQDSWTILFGKERVLIPMVEESSSTVRLYATPFFVSSPAVVDEYMKGSVLPAYENIYPHKNCILFLDPVSVPRPGGCYFDSSPPPNTIVYRLCFLTGESDSAVQPLIDEWKHRETHRKEIPFLTQDTIAVPKCIPFEPSSTWFDFPKESVKAHGTIQKRNAWAHPHLVLHDILFQYFRHLKTKEHNRAVSYSEMTSNVRDVGLVLEWPLAITYEGIYSEGEKRDHPQYVALAVNGNSPKNVIKVDQPYDYFTEFDYVPAIRWQPVSFEPRYLQLPNDLVKVSVDGMVMGFIHHRSFFCFGEPVIEGIPTEASQKNVEFLLTTVDDSTLRDEKRIRIVETFRLDERHSLHHVRFHGVGQSAWCISAAESTDAFARAIRLPFLVQEWTGLFKRFKKQERGVVVNTNVLKLAISLTRHGICFRVVIVEKHVPSYQEAIIDETNHEILLSMIKEEVEFVNEMRCAKPSRGVARREDASDCQVM